MNAVETTLPMKEFYELPEEVYWYAHELWRATGKTVIIGEHKKTFVGLIKGDMVIGYGTYDNPERQMPFDAETNVVGL